jgi:cell division protein FtsX
MNSRIEGIESIDAAPADAELVSSMTRIADGLDHLLVGIFACVALLALIALCEVVRLGVFT